MNKTFSKIDTTLGKHWLWLLVTVLVFIFLIVPIGNVLMRWTQGNNQRNRQQSANDLATQINAIQENAYAGQQGLNELEKSEIIMLESKLRTMGYAYTAPNCPSGGGYAARSNAMAAQAGENWNYDQLRRHFITC